MEEDLFQNANEALDHIEAILRELLWMSARAASDECSDAERAALQRDFAALREKADRFVDRYRAAAEQISRSIAVMETEQAPAPEGETGV